MNWIWIKSIRCFNALSGLYLISTRKSGLMYSLASTNSFQCPLGLIPHFYVSRQITCRETTNAFQCPLGLIPHFYIIILRELDLYMEVSMPSRAYTSFLLCPYRTKGAIIWQVSMPSRAYTSFLRYPFKNLGFMRFPEPVFAGIYQNILTTAVFRAC